MPTYTWENKRTGMQVEVFRKASEIDIAPSKEQGEIPDGSDVQDGDTWERVLVPNAGRGHLRSRGFGVKGHW